MHETIVANGQDALSPVDVGAVEKLRLLARWLHHCHEQARQRGQLGVLAPSFSTTDTGGSPSADRPGTVGWS
jgi:hypothetical protein